MFVIRSWFLPNATLASRGDKWSAGAVKSATPSLFSRLLGRLGLGKAVASASAHETQGGLPQKVVGRRFLPRPAVAAGSAVQQAVGVVKGAKPSVPVHLGAAALTDLLDKHPKVRLTLKQLSVVEQTLKLTKGLDSVPVSVLGPAVKQLEGLAAPFENDDLYMLHQAMQCRINDYSKRLATVERWSAPLPVADVMESAEGEGFSLFGLFDDAVHEGRRVVDFADTQPMMYPDELVAVAKPGAR